MTELDDLRKQREMVEALIFGVENAARVVDLCSDTTAADEDLPRLLADACGLSVFQAEVILTMQIRRLTPQALSRMRAQLLDIDRTIARLAAG